MRVLSKTELQTARQFRVARDLVVENNTTRYLVFNQPERGFVRVDQYAVIAPEVFVDETGFTPNILARIPKTTFRIYNGNNLVLPYDKNLATYTGIGVATMPNAAFNDEYLCALQKENQLEFNDHIFVEFSNYTWMNYELFPLPVRVILSGMIYILSIENYEEKSDFARIKSGDGRSVQRDFEHPPDDMMEGIR